MPPAEVLACVALKERNYGRQSWKSPRNSSRCSRARLGPTKQKAARLVVDLASTAAATEFIEVENAHVSGVSVITGGHGLRRFLADLSGDLDGKVAIPTTLNSAGCDHQKMDEMGIDHPDFLEQQFEIVHAYSELGIEAILSCTPYDRGIEEDEGFGLGPSLTQSAFPTHTPR
ncbi:MAG: hypothetical protein CM1200mP21_00500 [Candidatus Poseidoniales archaeon]|nr:MAG: hypothetical protein CM1200mP21_00500 [Candidatus Poseidoniales archaeon]